MQGCKKEVLETPKFNTFPRTLAEAKEFIKLKGLRTEGIDNETLASVIAKIANRTQLNGDDVSFMHRIFDLGDTCGCDSDHRLRGESTDGKAIGYSIS